MGRELAKHLLAAGHQLTVWNRTAAATDSLTDVGAVCADTPEHAAQGQDIVITCLFGPDTVHDVILNNDVLAPGTLWLDITTVGPDDADHFAAWAQQHGIRYVAGPVVGSLAPARAKKLGVYLGGAPADVAEARPFAALWADPERLVEVPTPRAAAVGKLLANLALGVALEGLVEALRFGRALGVGTADVLKMLKSTALNWIVDFKSSMILDNSFADTQFSVDLLAKDARLMLSAVPETAQAHTAINLPAVQALLATLETTQQAGHGDYDIAAAVIPELD